MKTDKPSIPTKVESNVKHKNLTIRKLENVVKSIQTNQERLKQGKHNCIPFPLKKLRKHVPGIIKGTPYIITANSGVGKSNLAKYLFVYSVYKYLRDNPNTDIKVKMYYFPLEESIEEFILSMVSRQLYEVYNLEYSVQQLQGYGEDPIPDDVLDKIQKSKDYFEDIFQHLEVVDDIANPTGIYKYMRQVAADNGKFYYQGKEVIPPADNNWINFKWDEYVEDDPNLYVISLIDHLSLLQEESGMSKHATITKWSADYNRYHLTKKMKQVVVNVQQQAADSEKQQFTNKGDSIKDKIKPTLDGLGDNKLTQRDALVIISLYAPYRYKFADWNGYILKDDTGRGLKDKYRVLEILKNRYGTPNLEDNLFFDGRVGEFKELPAPDDPKMNVIYKKYC